MRAISWTICISQNKCIFFISSIPTPSMSKWRTFASTEHTCSSFAVRSNGEYMAMICWNHNKSILFLNQRFDSTSSIIKFFFRAFQKVQLSSFYRLRCLKSPGGRCSESPTFNSYNAAIASFPWCTRSTHSVDTLGPPAKTTSIEFLCSWN